MLKKIAIIFIPFIITSALFLALYKGLSMDPHELPSEFINKKAPKIQLADLYQPHTFWSTKRLQAKANHHWYLVSVWASWCNSCKIEHPLLMDLARQDIIIYGINYKDTAQSAKKWLASYGNPYKAVFFDPTGNTIAQWGSYGVPETFLIDPHGIIRLRETGSLTQDLWKRKFLPLMNQPH